MSKPMRVKVKYVHGHFYIINLGIYRCYQAVIPIFDIWIGVGVMSEKLNYYVGIFRFCSVFCSSAPPPPDKNSKVRERYQLMSSLSKVSWAFVWNGSGRSWDLWLKKGETGRKYKDLLCSTIPISWCFLRKRSIMWAGQTKFPGPVWHASPTLIVHGVFNTWVLTFDIGSSKVTIQCLKNTRISLLSAALRSNAADYVLLLFILFFLFFYFLFFYSPFVLRNYSTDSHQIFRNCVFWFSLNNPVVLKFFWRHLAEKNAKNSENLVKISRVDSDFWQ